jgi:hypothetical protein
MGTATTKAEFPKTITHERLKNLTVKIYRADNDGKPEFTLVYYTLTGERRRVVRRDLPSLEATATEVLDDLATGRPVDSREALCTADRLEFAGLRAIFSEVGIAPLIGARHFVEGVKLLGGVDLVVEACRAYAARNMHKASDVTIETAKDEFIAAKEKAGKSRRYIKDLRYRLGRFAGCLVNKRLADYSTNSLRLKPSFKPASGRNRPTR